MYSSPAKLFAGEEFLQTLAMGQEILIAYLVTQINTYIIRNAKIPVAQDFLKIKIIEFANLVMKRACHVNKRKVNV